mmetsp:Transcript_30084/g.38649  ORF Transcript_30084/g.38649 Transcript_30084/m.38649 type:complete len:496 (-) Transcript_30084:113-1600(-)
MKKAGLENLCKVWEVKSLKLPRQKECQELLEKIARQVEPILMRRKWKVRLLTEFSPKDRGLLGMNVNRGQKILIRMRPAHSPNSFYPYEHLLGTMLHELAHMEIGPHNAAFQKLWDDLWDEVEQLMDQGITGKTQTSTSFSGVGHTLGGKKIGKRQLGSAIAAAAERRAQVQGMMTPQGGIRLGGSTSEIQNLRQRIRSAAQKRNLGSSCGVVSNNIAESGHSQNPQGKTRTQKQPLQKCIWICKRCTMLNGPTAEVCGTCGGSFSFSGIEATEWECNQCTLKNKGHVIECTICGEARDRQARNGIPKQETNQDNWQCRACTFSNPPGTSSCEVCENTRSAFSSDHLQIRQQENTENSQLKSINQWTCETCTVINQHDRNVCDLCGYDQSGSCKSGFNEYTGERPRKHARSALSILSENNVKMSPKKESSCLEQSGSHAWSCEQCTFINPAKTMQCGVCNHAFQWKKKSIQQRNNSKIKSTVFGQDEDIIDLCMF